MLKELKRFLIKSFREFLVYHHSSLEYRAKLLTLFVSHDGQIDECEKQKLKEIAHTIYPNDIERAQLLVDTVFEYHEKIVTDNGLNFEDLILQVQKETKDNENFAHKIDLDLLSLLHECIDEEDEQKHLFSQRVYEYLMYLKQEYTKHTHRN